MSGFIYYIPKVRGVGPNDIDRVGLRSVFGEVESGAHGFIDRGPDGPGCVLVVDDTGEDLAYDPGAQKWQRTPCGQYWVGWNREQKPGPGDLERPEMVDGYPVLLEDGNRWRVPIARNFPQGSPLPQALKLGPDGQVVREALPRFARLCGDAQKIWDAFYGDSSLDRMDEAETFAIASQAIGLNYRVGMVELSVLGIITTGNIGLVLGAIVDLPMFLEKKTAQLAAAGNQDLSSGSVD